nr:ribonuclease H-like domain-containing protein [Tanacetum cinerariifolium]
MEHTCCVNTANGVSTAGTQVNTANIDNFSDVVTCAFLASQPSSPQLVNEDLEQIHPDDLEEMDLKWQMAMLTMRAKRFLKNTRRKLNLNGTKISTRAQDNRNKESTRKNVLVETTNSLALVSCDGLGGYDWSDQVKDGPNYALMAYFTSRSNFESTRAQDNRNKESTRKNVLVETTNSLALVSCDGLGGYDWSNQVKDGPNYALMAYFTSRSNFELEIVQKEKDSIQLTVEKLKNASKSLNKLIDSQIVDNCKKGLGYNAVPPPQTGLFMPPKPDLSYIGLEEFTSEPAIKTVNAKTSEDVPKVVKNDNGAPIIKDWMSDDEDASVPQPKIEKKTVKPSVAKVEFVMPKQ